MSDGFDGGYDGGDASHVDAGQEHYSLEHGASEYGADQDHSLDHQAYGQADHHEADQHYAHGEAEHYHSPAGEEYDRQEFTNFDGHESSDHAAFGESLQQFDSSEQFGSIDHLAQQFDASHFNATEFEGGEGQGHISAVSN
jgi:hypothetical protein